LCCTNILRRGKTFFCCHQILLQPLFQFKNTQKKNFWLDTKWMVGVKSFLFVQGLKILLRI
jgi:hypothetical protein